jgi:hypothetical protein
MTIEEINELPCMFMIVHVFSCFFMYFPFYRGQLMGYGSSSGQWSIKWKNMKNQNK